MKVATRMRKSFILSSFCCSCLVMASSQAQENPVVLGLDFGNTETDDRANTEFMNIPDGQVSLDNLNLAAKGTAWSVFAGYELTPRFTVELSYADLGELQPRFGRESLRLEPEEVAVRLRYDLPVYREFALHLVAGVSHASFATSGTYSRPDPCFPSPPGAGGAPCPGPDVTVTAAEPEAEIGNLWGLGFSWNASDAISIDLRYSHHDVKVLNINRYSLGVRWRL